MLKTATYITKERTKDYYITLSKSVNDSNFISDATFIAGGVTLFMKKVHPAVSAVLFIIDAIMWFNEKANEVALDTYERAMNEGEGVLILTWEVSGLRCGYYSSVKYLPLSSGGV